MTPKDRGRALLRPSVAPPLGGNGKGLLTASVRRTAGTCVLVAAVMALGACTTPGSPVPESSWWSPTPGESWQVQLADGLDTEVDAQIYDVDSNDTSSKDLETARRQGAHLVCYFNAGAWEQWREDATGFENALLGNELE